MKLNISIDDVSPHPQSSIKVLDRCFELIDQIPDIKFTLFVPTAYWRTIRKEVATPSALYISQYPDFIDYLKKLPKSNFELCYHGLFHGVPGRTDNDEFQFLTYDEAIEKFNLMFEETKRAGIHEDFEMIFRPPAWRMSPGAIKAAADVGIQVLALSPSDYAVATYKGEEKNFRKVVYFDASPPIVPLPKTEIDLPTLEIVYHACEWDKSYLNKELSRELADWIEMKEIVQFCFIEELCLL